MQGEESTFVQHEPCPRCQANGDDIDGNNLARYSDGHGYCFKCQYYEDSEGNNNDNKDDDGSCEVSPSYSGNSFLPCDYQPLTSRKITLETCRKFGYGIGLYHGKPAQIASYRSSEKKDGAIIAQHIRMAGKEFRWIGDTSHLQLFGQHLWKPGGKRVIITEGEIDCLTVSQLQGNKWPVVSIPSGATSAVKYLKQNLEWLESFESVVLAFDMDEPGRKAVNACAPLFSPGKVAIAELPAKDPNEALKQGKIEPLIQSLWNAHPWRPDGILSGSDLWEDILLPPAEGWSLPYPGLEAKLQGFRQGELYLFSAGSGIGKSTLVNEIAYHLHMKHKLPLGVIALEENPARNARRYLSIYLNKPLNIPAVYNSTPKDELKEAFDKVLGSGWYIYDHFGSTDIDGLLAKLRYMVVSLGCKVIVLDHISIVVSGLDEADGESERKTIDKLMTRLRQLIEETNVMVLAVVHLKRPDKGKSYNEGRPVTLTDLRGSGSLEQISDAVIALERDQQGDDPNLTIIRVLKNRPIGDCGQAGFVRYFPDTGRLISDDGNQSGFTSEEPEAPDEDKDF